MFYLANRNLVDCFHNVYFFQFRGMCWLESHYCYFFTSSVFLLLFLLLGFHFVVLRLLRRWELVSRAWRIGDVFTWEISQSQLHLSTGNAAKVWYYKIKQRRQYSVCLFINIFIITRNIAATLDGSESIVFKSVR